ncbi:MAG: tetratricopeptide repeat-containing sensor histidine kinase [Flavobacteriales bacterium]
MKSIHRIQFNKRNILVSFCLLFGLLLISISGFSQTTLQEIKYKIDTAQKIEAKVNYMMDLSEHYFQMYVDSLDKAIEIIDETVKFSKGKGISYVETWAYNLKASINYEKGDLPNALENYENAKEIAELQKNDKRVNQIKDNMADVLYDMGRKDEAISLRFSARDYFNGKNDSTSWIICQSGLVYMFMQDGRNKDMIDAAKEAIDYGYDYPSMIEIYGNMGIVYERVNKLDSAEYFMSLAGEMGKDYPLFLLDNQTALAQVIKKRGDTTRALETLLDVHNSFEPQTKSKSYFILKVLIAETYMQLGEYENAEKFLEQTDGNISNSILIQQRKIGKIGKDIYFNQGKYKKAYYYSEMYHAAKDSINDAKRDSSYKLIQEKYNVAQKQETINSQKIKLKNYTIYIIALAALLLLGGLIYYNARKKTIFKQKIAEEKQKAKEQEIQSLKKENKIISMQSMLEGQEEERRRIAQDLHDNIGTLMASIKLKFLSIQKEMEDIQKMNIAGELDSMISNASQEVRRISHRMTPRVLEITGLKGAVEELRPQLIAENIKFKSNNELLGQITDKNLSINIYRVIQEIFNNIVKHSKADLVSMNSEIREDELVLRIRDNGIGFSPEKWENSNSVGLSSIKSRVEYLNGKIKLIEDEGTHYKISIPLT